MNWNNTAAAAATVLALAGFSGAAQAAFQGRLANFTPSTTCTGTGPGKCTYFYDTNRDATILNNWNIGEGSWSASAAPGSAQAVAASAGFAASGLTGWVLPTGDANFFGGSENHYFSIAFDLFFSGVALPDQFDGAQYGASYWSSSEDSPGVSSLNASLTRFGGSITSSPQTDSFFAVAVRPGDIAAVPEPQSHATMLAGLCALMVFVRRRQRLVAARFATAR